MKDEEGVLTVRFVLGDSALAFILCFHPSAFILHPSSLPFSAY
jgi:hypothetical protein